jgi:hypothetical protein
MGMKDLDEEGLIKAQYVDRVFELDCFLDDDVWSLLEFMDVNEYRYVKRLKIDHWMVDVISYISEAIRV